MDHANVGKKKVADRADVSEKQVDLSFLIAMYTKGAASYQSIRKGLPVAGPGGGNPVDGKIGNT